MHTASQKGFTLIEVTLALAVLAFLMGGIFVTMQQSLRFNLSLREIQNENTHLFSFLYLLRTELKKLSGETQIFLAAEDSFSKNPSELILQNTPNAFSWGKNSLGANTIVLSAEKKSRGTLQLNLIYFDGNYRDKIERRDQERYIATLTLMDNLKELTWNVFDDRTQDWEENWDNARRPQLIELQITPLGATDPQRHVFWVPPLLNPAQNISTNIPIENQPKTEIEQPASQTTPQAPRINASQPQQ